MQRTIVWILRSLRKSYLINMFWNKILNRKWFLILHSVPLSHFEKKCWTPEGHICLIAMVGQGISRTRKVFLWRQNCQTSFAFFFLSFFFLPTNLKIKRCTWKLKTRNIGLRMGQSGQICKYSLCRYKMRFPPKPDQSNNHLQRNSKFLVLYEQNRAAVSD